MTPSTGAAAAVDRPSHPEGAYAAPADLHRLSVGGRPLLFSTRCQRIYQLNETADLIWRRLSQGEPPARAAADLEALGADADTARAFVETSLRAWLLGGQLLPLAVTEALEGAPAAVRTLSIEEVPVVLAFFGEAAAADCDAAFAQFYGPVALGAPRLALVGHEGLTYFFLDGRPRAVSEPDGVTAHLKAILTDIYTNALESGFLAHGALLVRNDRAVFLSGEPGAGKTTLTLALAADGWAYGSDDIVRVQPDGTARGTPFAAGVKSGAWPLVAPRWPELEALPVWQREDGQRVRYLLPPERADGQFRPMHAVLLLARQEGARAQLEPVEPLAALGEILAGAYASGWKLDAPSLQALAARMEAAICRRLVYSDLDEAVRLIRGLADG